MMNLHKKSVFLAITTLSFSMWLSSCRFGNHADPYKNLSPSTFKTLDLYHTHPVSFETSVYFSAPTAADPNNLTVKQNLNTAMRDIPGWILSVFTDPVYYGVLNDPKLPQVFINITGDLGNIFQTLVGSDQKIKYDSGFDAQYWEYFWNSKTCGTQVQDVHSGSFNTTHPDTYIFSDLTQKPIKGDLYLTIQKIRYFTGTCNSVFSELATCYLNGSGCSPAQLQEAIYIFDLPVRAGLINLSSDDLSKIKGLEYTIKYE